MKYRTEVDSLGQKKVPREAYYGIQTVRAVENFPVSGAKTPELFIRAYVTVKKASAMANMQVGWLDERSGTVIIRSCDEVLQGKMLDQFVVDVFRPAQAPLSI
jgi:aspartate ammonia-lyase